MKFWKRIAAAACALLFSAAPAGCAYRGDELGAPAQPEALSFTERESEGLAALQAGAADFSARFAAAAYAARAQNGEQNFAVSPLSAYMALALAAECTAGETQAQLLQALGTDAQALGENFALLYRGVFRDAERAKVLPTNSIWLQEGLPFEEACVGALAEKYFCHSYAADFAGRNKEANAALRSFIKEQTKGLIDRSFGLNELTAFALVNTLYLKDVWLQDGGDLALTEPLPFAQADGSVKKLRMLRGTYTAGRPHEGDGYASFFAELQGGCRLLLLLPDEGKSVGDVFTAGNIAEACAADANAAGEDGETLYFTRCIFPAFTAGGSADLKALLEEEFGIGDFFDENACDLSPLLPEANNMCCNSVRQEVQLNVDRKGVEGAAATVISVGPTSAAPGGKEVYLDFTVDRAFGFILLGADGSVLFAGAVEQV